MKNILFLLFLFSVTVSVLKAQDQNSRLYLIHFKDKGLQKALLSSPEDILSSAAIERRQRHHIDIDESDLPVNESYVHRIAELGVRVVCRSRWFNYIIVESDNLDPVQLSKFSFVKDFQQLSSRKTAVTEMSDSKPFFREESLIPYSGSYKKVNSGVYNYGAAANQINMIKGEYLHNMGYSGQGMTIAVIDAGFNSVDVMDAFDSLRANNQILGTKNYVEPNGNVYSTSISTHGAMVLSTMAANIPGQMVGTAPKAHYWLLRTEDAPTEYILEEYFWVSAAEFADSVGADIINSSLGYTTFDNPATNHTYADMDGNTTHITIGADKAAEKGILVVNSAGNSGGDPWTYIGAPADGDSVFTIGAVDAFGNYAYFSSKGPTFDRRIKPEIVSQGLNAAVIGPNGLGYGSGTSFSSPIIAGMSACLWQAAPSLSNMQIIASLKVTASKAADPDTLLGWGIPDYSAAYGVLGTANLKKADEVLGFSIAPNPIGDFFYIQFNSEVTGSVGVDLINMGGKIVYHPDEVRNIHGRIVRIGGTGHLAPGIYLLRIKTDRGVISKLISKL
jgi:hypothetical protein